MKTSGVLLSVATLALLSVAGAAASLVRSQGPVPLAKQHEWLLSHTGKWDAKVSGMMGESTGTWEVVAGPGNRWVVGQIRTEMMGMPFHGMEIQGFDPESGTFTSLWVDSMTNTHQVMTGKYDEATHTMTMTGESVGMDGNPTSTTQITRYPDADHMTFEMLMGGPDDVDTAVMTIAYTRKK